MAIRMEDRGTVLRLFQDKDRASLNGEPVRYALGWIAWHDVDGWVDNAGPIPKSWSPDSQHLQ